MIQNIFCCSMLFAFSYHLMNCLQSFFIVSQTHDKGYILRTPALQHLVASIPKCINEPIKNKR